MNRSNVAVVIFLIGCVVIFFGIILMEYTIGYFSLGDTPRLIISKPYEVLGIFLIFVGVIMLIGAIILNYVKRKYR